MNKELYELLMKKLVEIDSKKIEDIEVRCVEEGGNADRITVDIYYKN